MDNHEGPTGRRSSLKPTLAKIPSGVGMDNQAFEMGEEPGTYSRSSSIMRATRANFGGGGGPYLGRRMTREALPQLGNYSNDLKEMRKAEPRPTIEELHESSGDDKEGVRNLDGVLPAEREKFGWIEGCLIRNMLNIWGVMLFLRISWVVALSGIWQTLIIIAISTFITMVTALSTSAISTNGEIGGGGTYYVMSRILGPEWGGSIGVLFALANAVNCSLNVVGFVQTVQDAMKNYGGYIIVDGGINDTRILGAILMVLVWALCGAGAKYEMMTQQFLLVVLVVALTNFVAGSIIGPRTDDARARGFLGYETVLFQETWNSAYVVNGGILQDFFSVFAVYFPAGIGILAGANVSGDLKNPNEAIPKGTIWAIIITSISYAIVAIICAGTTVRQATGSVVDYLNGTNLDCVRHNCTYGSYNDYQLMTLISAYGPLNYAGCFASTLSTALASYISCPKLLQVIGDDKLFPHWMVGCMTKGYGKAKEPHWAYLFTFILSMIFILIAQLDLIALLISDLFLITFAFLNYACFHVDFVQPIGWRPTFRFYDKWLSLFNAALCVACMFLFDWRVALVTIAFVLALYFVVLYRKPEVNWGSSPQAMNFQGALTNIQQLASIEEHVKNYQPNVLAMTGDPGARPALVDFGYLICKKNSMLVCGNVIAEKQTSKMRLATTKKAYNYLRAKQIKGFCTIIDNMEMAAGTTAMLEVTGVGKIKPNVLLLGFKSDWKACDRIALEHYFATIHAGFEQHVGVAILRVDEGLDYSSIVADEDLLTELEKAKIINGTVPPQADGASGDESSDADKKKKKKKGNKDNKDKTKDVATPVPSRVKKEQIVIRDKEGNELPRHIVNNITIFRRKQQKGFIDIWWLFDDGGLTLLLPYIISTRSNWASCKLRVFCTAPGKEELDKEKQDIAALLELFRINHSELVVINDMTKQPKESTRAWFDGIIRPFVRREEITEAERTTLNAKTERNLRLRELLVDHSSDSNLVVVTLPLPRKGGVTAPMYMAWLEALTANMPPFLLVRGNQTSVLTFYA